VATQGDSLEVVIPLDATGLDDDGVALFGFVTGLFMGGQPVTEDEAFDGVSSSRERRLTLSSSAVAAPALPVLGLATRIGLVAALVVAAEARRRRRSAAPGAADRP
jgi:hypothetical protein